ncbi:MAG: hypothetical protein ACRCY8_00555 [Dermatophilaceae bacterium]
MPRRRGSRNHDYDRSRRTLTRVLAPHLVDELGRPSTLKALATAAEVSVPTLRHYFGDREGVVRAVLLGVQEDSRQYLQQIVDSPGDDADHVLVTMLIGVVDAWQQHGFGRLFSSALSLGLEDPALGPAVVAQVLEPLLTAVEALLARLAQDATLPVHDSRAAALSLLGPTLLVLAHQDSLGGAEHHPIDVTDFVRLHVKTVLYGIAGR